jgi:outer membrane protein assembly factor BamB
MNLVPNRAQNGRAASCVVLLLAPLLLCLPIAAESVDWPQWRGPDLNGVSQESDLPLTWSATKNGARNVCWSTPLPGVSGATPIIAGDHIFLNVALDEELEFWALSKADGKVAWKRQLGGGNYKRMKHNMSSPSPVTDGKLVWNLTGTGVLKAFDFDGAELWSRDLQADYGPFGLNHGYGASPLLHDGVLYVPVLHGMKTDDPSYVLAIRARDGETLWRVERPTDAVKESPDAYTTPMIWSHHGYSELVITGGDYATGHDLVTGKETWRIGGMNPQGAPNYRVVASPLVFGDMLYVPSRVSPLLALEARDGAAPQLVWQLEEATDVPTPVVHDGVLYVLSDRGMLSAYDARTGAVHFEQERIQAGTYSSSPLVAEGRLYLTNEDGMTSVVRAGKELEILAENPADGYTLSSIAVSDGRFYLRTAEALYCID